MWNKTENTLIGCEKTYQEADLVVFGVPFDGTTSFRPGTRFAGQAMRSEGYGLEGYSPYQDGDLRQLAAFDGGDLNLPFGNPVKMLDIVRETVLKIVTDGKRPCMIGGEHLVSLGAVQAMIQRYPDLHIIHLDAHTDLRDDYLGEKLSHATVMRRIWELVGDQKIFQFGIRSGEKEEFVFAQQHMKIQTYTMDGIQETIKEIGSKPIYFTLDLDVLDPSIFPGTGTPEPGGISFMELLRAVLCLRQANVVGADMVELSPSYDASGVSTVVACKIMRELLLAIGVDHKSLS